MLHGHCCVYIQRKNQLPVLVFSRANLITNIGRRVFARQLIDASYPPPSRIRFGRLGLDDGVPRALDPTATNIADPTYVEKNQYPGSPILVYNPPEVSTRFVFALAKTEGNLDGAVTNYSEAGLFNSLGEMVAIESFPIIPKTPDIRLIYQWAIYQDP